MSANAVSSAKSSGNKVTSATSTGRPSLKNLTRARVPRAGIIGTSVAVIAAVSWKLFVSDRHKRDIATFYKLVLFFSFNYSYFRNIFFSKDIRSRT